MTHHTIRDHSLTPATDSARGVIAAGEAAMAVKLAAKGAEGVTARLCMALQNAYLLAVSQEVDLGAGRLDLHNATIRAVGCVMSQANGMIFRDAPEGVRHAAFMDMIQAAANFALAAHNAGDDATIVSATVTLPQAGAA